MQFETLRFNTKEAIPTKFTGLALLPYVKIHMLDGVPHREDGPAVTKYKKHFSTEIEQTEWHQDGKLHRLDGPAIQTSKGNWFYYIHGKEFQSKEYKEKIEEFKTSSISSIIQLPDYFTGIVRLEEFRVRNGEIISIHEHRWYKNGNVHRENDLPARILKSGEQRWYLNGELHRLTGPAVVSAMGAKEYYVRGFRYNPSKFMELISYQNI